MPSDDIVLQENKLKEIAMFFGCFFFAIFGAVLLRYPTDEIIPKVSGLFLLIFFGAAVIIYPLFLIMYKATARFSREGISLYLARNCTVKISWRDVKSIGLQLVGEPIQITKDYLKEPVKNSVNIAGTLLVHDFLGIDFNLASMIVIVPRVYPDLSFKFGTINVIAKPGSYDDYVGAVKGAIYIPLNRFMDEKQLKELPHRFDIMGIKLETMPIALKTKDKKLYQKALADSSNYLQIG